MAKVVRVLIGLCCASRVLLAQHEHHAMRAAGTTTVDYQAFLLYTRQGGPRGDHGLALSDREHFQAQHAAAGWTLSARAMTSLGALVTDRAGSPQLLQTGGTYRNGYIHDRQHPHDLVMEAAVEARRALSRRATIALYLAPIGSPALGPAPYQHRPSAAFDPETPIGHHWQDASHVSSGVAWIGMSASRVVLEGSAFNARESDYEAPWPDWSHGALDSWAGRVTINARPLTITGWWGYLKHHDPDAPGMQMHRYGASVGHRARPAGHDWSSLAVWGMNVHHHDGSSHLLLHGDPNASPHVWSSSALVESSVAVSSRLTVFARAERVVKDGEELGFLGGDLMQQYLVHTIGIGGARTLHRFTSAEFAIGAKATLNVVPSSLVATYGSRHPAGLDVYVRVATPNARP